MPAERDELGRRISSIGLPIPGSEHELEWGRRNSEDETSSPSTPAQPVEARSIDWEALGGDIAARVTTTLSEVLRGTTADLREYGDRIAELAIAAARDGRSLRESEAQLKLLVERSRIRAVREGWALVRSIGMTALRVVQALAKVAL